ncbi:hypothetical protein [Aurantiacibacter poecillastricola]|uniref:hypothetical protein n=1 Tax=Aurantiacibacter poecillastricola TaxID=3064385 RepID=UPI00273FE049|nr:hypothetical protein [Aurantiacibacter sp. 219JJ12-13]MDP5261597.1 hypothetical protein [Aurantiacibacter sp. 219JJ12-13]
MSTDFAILLLLLAPVCAYAFLKGGKPEQYCALVIIAGTAFDRLYPWIFGPRGFHEFSLSRLLTETVLLLVFTSIALRANRNWPLIVAAAQLVAVAGSFAPLAVRGGYDQAYWALTQLPLVIQLLALSAGTCLHSLRDARVGPYNDWSPAKQDC